MSRKANFNINRLARIVALLAVLSAWTFHADPEALSPGDLAGASGNGFWSDPCTWDGFATGSGIILCGTGSAGGCIAALSGILRAVYIDNCFK